MKSILATLLVVFIAWGCKDDPARPDLPAAGVYTVKTLNDQPLPGVFVSGLSSTTVLVADTLELKGNSTFRNGYTYQILSSGGAVTSTVNKQITGQWEVLEGENVPAGTTAISLHHFSDSASKPQTILHSGSEIKFTVLGDRFVYGR